MKRILFIVLISLGIQPVISQSILLECGQNSGQNFDGWHLSPFNVFDEIEFDEQSVSFFSEYGGNFPVTLTRKVEGLSEYKKLNLLFNFETVNNCSIENVKYYTSVDGKVWDPVTDYAATHPGSQNNQAVNVFNDSLDIAYVRAIANTDFAVNGKLTCNYVKIEGSGKDEPSIELLAIEEEPLENNFFIFSYEHTLNIETGLERSYEVLITSVSGQIVYREELEGSTRIALPEELTGIYVVSIIQDNAFQASKKVVF